MNNPANVIPSVRRSVRAREEFVTAEQLDAVVRQVVTTHTVWDVHTHLYPPSFGTPSAGRNGKADPQGLLLWGIDELLTYHYLVAEVFRRVPATTLPYERFWRMTKAEQADHIWKHLFVEASPISEACRGVLTTLQAFGLDPSERDLDGYRLWFAEQDVDEHIDQVMQKSGVSKITMTNAVFDDNERDRWLQNPHIGADSRFAATLRIDPLLRDWPLAARRLHDWGYDVSDALDDRSLRGVRQFLNDWIDRVQAVYCAASLPPSFRYGGPECNRPGSIVLRDALLPVLASRNMSMALMIGSEIGVNPALREAGDMSGLSDIASLVRLCADFPDNRFLCTMLARENQHELPVAARKFGNLMIFGCWWFLNTPSLVAEITKLRLELLGTSFIPQHSDARVLEHLVYKWQHSRATIADVLCQKYADLQYTGWRVTREEIVADVHELLYENVTASLSGSTSA